MRARYRVRGWLDRDTFYDLLKFSKYIGREKGYVLFELDEEKMKREGLGIADVYAKLSSLDVVEEDLRGIEALFREKTSVEVWLEADGWLRVKSRILLKPLISKLGVYLPYDRDRRAYKAPPYMYAQLVKLFRDHGLSVNDSIGLLDKAGMGRRLSFKGSLRPYQEEALKKWVENGYKGVIALPTGAGKTVIAIAALARLSVRTLVVVYTKEHVKQWIDAIRSFTDAGSLVGAYYGEEKTIAPITVTTYQTAFKKASLFSARFALLVFDEAHHLPAEKFRFIALRMASPYRMGLSATVEREDGKHEEIFPLIGGIVFHASPKDLAKQGFLAPFIIRRVKVDLSEEERRKYDEKKRRFQALAGNRSFQELVEAAKRGDPTAVEALKIHADMRSIINESEEKLRAAERIAREELEKGSKIIVFTQYKKQAEEIARRLNSYLLHGGMDAQSRARTLDRFKKAKSGVLVVTTVGDEGLDIPDANVGILLSGTGSRRQFIQRLGRLLRPKEGKKAVLYEVITAKTSEEYQSLRRRGIL
ncbi:MAG: DEAD/DEAH box helicase [Desulfurococcales archaeon]|nr:DEAD/DEAH box helicase [Desulfurococcales archaeon]